jgi:DNA-binding MarR family transcriptional regulator
MTEDVVQTLGYLTLGSRLKRLGERLQGQTQVVLTMADIDVPAAQLPALAALDRLGPLSIGDLSKALGVAQPGVTRITANLETAGLVSSRRKTGDRRVSTIALTARGRRLVERSKRTLWPAIDAAVAQACAGLSGPLLAQLKALEEALAAVPLAARTQHVRAGGSDDAPA